MLIDFNSWFSFSLLATILFGIMTALYKFPAVKGYNKFSVMVWSLALSTIASLVLFHKYLVNINTTALVSAGIWGITYTALTLLQMHALTHVDTGTLFPTTSTLSLALIVLVGITLFGDRLSFLQIAGLVLIMGAVYFFLYTKGKRQYTKYVLLIGMSIVVLSALNKIIQKVAVNAADIRGYQFYQFAFALIFSLIVLYYYHRKDFKEQLFSKAYKIGCCIGALGFAGGYLFLIALQKGSVSLVNSIHSLYVLVAAILGFVLFKEKLSLKKLALIGMCIVGVIFIRVG
jgi:uncharacterized membrane protein